MKGCAASRLLRAATCGALILGLSGCASTGGDPRDPLEPMNRAVYKFNEKFDEVLARPVAEAYRDFVPSVVRTGVGNFFSNIGDIVIGINDLLQGKMTEAINDFGRVMVNTTLGVLGLWDRATELGVEKRNEDFGQTLGWWGFGDGPYLVLPFLGPSNLRDTFGWAGDIYAWPVTYVEPTRTRNLLVATRFIHTRAELLEATRILETAALDPYEFTRDAYLQRRRNLVHDGNPPPEDLEDESEPKKAPPSSGAAGQDDASSARGAGTPSEGTRPMGETPASTPDHSSANGTHPGESRFVRVWLP